LWDSLVVTIGSNANALQFDEIVSSLLSEEMRQKDMEDQNGDSLSLREQSQNINKNKSSSRRYKSRWRSKSPGKHIKVCWKCATEGHYKKGCKSKAPEKGKGSNAAPFAEVKTTLDEGGDIYLSSSSSTHVNREAYLIKSGASFHFTPHREWFCKFEKYDGGDVFLGYERKARIIRHGKVKLNLQGGIK